MSKLIMFEFKCGTCGHEFEDLVQPSINVIDCPLCRAAATRQLSAGHLDYRIGVSLDFPTAAAKWEKIHRQNSRVDKGGIADGAPNLKMY